MAAPREDSGISSAELVYSCPLSLPGQLLSSAKPPPTSFIHQLHSTLPCVADRPHRLHESPASVWRLQEVAYMYVKAAPVSPAYIGQYCVLSPGTRYFVLEVAW